MTAPYILARTLKEAHEYARGELGLTVGHYRIVNSSGTLKSVRGADLHLVPGWERRYDRFAMQSALRWTRMNVIDVATEPAEAPEDPRGPLTDEVLDLAYAEHSVRSGQGAPGIQTSQPDGLEPAGEQLTIDDISNGDIMTSEGSPAFPVEEPEVKDPEPAPRPKNRRRSRCKSCGTLHFKDDPCPEGEES